MKKLLFLSFLFTISLLCFECSAAVYGHPTSSRDLVRLGMFGMDGKKVNWLLFDYGKNSDGTPFVILLESMFLEFGVRVQPARKEEVVQFLISSGVSSKLASYVSAIYYRYEYTPDGKQCALINTQYYEGYSGSLCYSVDEASKNFTAIPTGSALEKAVQHLIKTGKNGSVPKNTTSKYPRVRVKSRSK